VVGACAVSDNYALAVRSPVVMPVAAQLQIEQNGRRGQKREEPNGLSHDFRVLSGFVL